MTATKTDVLTLTLNINGEQEIHVFNSSKDMHSFLDSVTFDLECDGLTVTDETWISCEDADSFEVELTIESDKSDGEGSFECDLDFDYNCEE